MAPKPIKVALLVESGELGDELRVVEFDDAAVHLGSLLVLVLRVPQHYSFLRGACAAGKQSEVRLDVDVVHLVWAGI